MKNNLQFLQSCTKEQLAEFLDEHGMFDNTPWNDWFDDAYCSKCEDIEVQCDGEYAVFGSGKYICSYCELNGKCRFFDHLSENPSNLEVIKMWLDKGCEDKYGSNYSKIK